MDVSCHHYLGGPSSSTPVCAKGRKIRWTIGSQLGFFRAGEKASQGSERRMKAGVKGSAEILAEREREQSWYTA